jgi:hypothetical protein
VPLIRTRARRRRNGSFSFFSSCRRDLKSEGVARTPCSQHTSKYAVHAAVHLRSIARIAVPGFNVHYDGTLRPISIAVPAVRASRRKGTFYTAHRFTCDCGRLMCYLDARKPAYRKRVRLCLRGAHTKHNCPVTYVNWQGWTGQAGKGTIGSRALDGVLSIKTVQRCSCTKCNGKTPFVNYWT